MRELPPRTACRCCFLLWTLTRLLLHLLRTCCSTLVLLVHSFRPAWRLLLRRVRGRCRFWLGAQEDRCHLLVLLPIDLNVLVLLIGRILAWLQGISQCHIALEFHWRLVFYDARSNHKVPRWYRWVGWRLCWLRWVYERNRAVDIAEMAGEQMLMLLQSFLVILDEYWTFGLIN